MIYDDKAKLVNEALGNMDKNGLLLVSGAEKPNVMTCSWCGMGFFWGKSILMIPVRKTRYTHELLEQNGQFTVNIGDESMHDALAFCGSKSGRKVDKFEGAYLKTADAKSVNVPIVCNATYHIECKVLGKTEMIPENLSDDINKAWYGNGDYHTIYMGEIVEAYRNEGCAL